MSSISSSSSYDSSAVGGGIVGLSLEERTVGRGILEAVPRHIPTVLANLIASYLPKQKGVFAESDWNELCGRVALAPPLPLDIEEIWEGPCAIFPGKKVKESHLLVYLPTTVDDKPLTLTTLGEIAKQRCFPVSERGYEHIMDHIVRQMGDQPVSTASWVLMTKTVIDGSRNANCAIQQTMITDLANKANVPYTIPTVLQATICILTHYMRTQERLFCDNNPKTYTRCLECIMSCQLMVGSFSTGGLCVQNSANLVRDYCGVAALRKF